MGQKTERLAYFFVTNIVQKFVSSGSHFHGKGEYPEQSVARWLARWRMLETYASVLGEVVLLGHSRHLR